MQTIHPGQIARLLAILGGFVMMFPGGGTATAANGPVSRNRDLETAVVNRLREQGLGQITILTPGDSDRDGASQANGQYQTPGGKSQQQTDSGRYEHRWAQSAQDRRLQQRIASQLQEGIPDGQDLYVLVQNGQAFLYGRVRNQEQQQRAVEIVRETRGIERIRNQLTVAEQGWQRRDDSQIEDAIRDELYWSPFVDAGQIEVDVNQGIATLSGTVDSFGGLIVAVESVFHGGARTVHNQLQIVRPADRSGADDAVGRQFHTGPGRSR